MIEPEKKEDGRAGPDERLEKAKKTVDVASLTLGALGSSGSLFWVIRLACGHWNIEPPPALLLAVIGIACLPLLCLTAYRFAPESAWIEKLFKACAYTSLATAVLCVGGLQAAHVVRYGWSHWNCLGAGQTWQEKHPDIRGTVVAFICGGAACSREQAINYASPRMVVEFDRRAWYEARIGSIGAECRTVTFSSKPGAWLPDIGGRVAAASDICYSILPQAEVSWHPIR
jgi:hypothetical protein